MSDRAAAGTHGSESPPDPRQIIYGTFSGLSIIERIRIVQQKLDFFQTSYQTFSGLSDKGKRDQGQYWCDLMLEHERWLGTYKEQLEEHHFGKGGLHLSDLVEGKTFAELPPTDALIVTCRSSLSDLSAMYQTSSTRNADATNQQTDTLINATAKEFIENSHLLATRWFGECSSKRSQAWDRLRAAD